MARVFRLGDFFGITASQLVLFKPEKFDKLLEYHYNAQASESLYSLTKELEFLKGALTTEFMQPNYDSLMHDFRMLGYLGLSDDVNDGKAKMQIAKFYKDSENMSLDELTEKYGSDTKDIMTMIQESLNIDAAAAYPGIGVECIPVVNQLFANMDYLRDIQKKCQFAYDNSHVREAKVAGRPLREVIELDMDGTQENKSCCYFVNQLYTQLKSTRNQIAREHAMTELEQNIRSIQREYDAKDIEFTPISVIRDTLMEVYEEMSVSRFNEILGTSYTEEEVDKIFKKLDSYRLGGLGFNSNDMGMELVNILQHEKRSGIQVSKKERNPKLDALLAIAFADLKSKQYMQSL